jgi:hypothetical protein
MKKVVSDDGGVQLTGTTLDLKVKFDPVIPYLLFFRNKVAS